MTNLQCLIVACVIGSLVGISPMAFILWTQWRENKSDSKIKMNSKKEEKPCHKK